MRRKGTKKHVLSVHVYLDYRVLLKTMMFYFLIFFHSEWNQNYQ